MVATAHETVVTLDRVPIGYVFIGIVTESETYRIYELILLII
jgi:hypothetical protein